MIFRTSYKENNLGEKLFESFQMQLNYAAVTDGRITGIDNDFTNTCMYLSGGSQSKLPLEYFDEMLSYVYNFDSQTAQAKKSIRAALSSALMAGHALASLEISFETPYANYDYINSYFNGCRQYLQNNDGAIKTNNGGQWSNIAGMELRLGYLQFVHYSCAFYTVIGTQGVAELGTAKGQIKKSDVTKTMLAYGSAVNAETVQKMIVRAKASGFDSLESNLLAAGYDRDMVLNKSDYLVTSSVWGSYREDVKGDSLTCVDVIYNASNYYVEGERYKLSNTGLDERWAIRADVTDIYTGVQTSGAEILISGYQWFHNLFKKNDEIYFSGALSNNYRYIKFY